mmetsp:Transcript_29301/g.64826  ORF Transcript_29301/g.64826 Transcript_29301/m.64826 type:complete len:785 (+) Transcript_29301:192-2546(+)
MSNAPLLPLVVLLGALFTVTQAGFTVEQAAIRIISPPNYKTQRLKWALADFGEPKYGGTLVGKLIYPTEDPSFYPIGQRPPVKCPADQPDAQYGCAPFSSCGGYQVSKEPGKFNIMMVDRGPRGTGASPCFFINKVYNAQLAGADAVLVVNDEDGDDLSTAVVPDDDKNAGLLRNLTVSAGMITRADGELLKGLLRGGKSVTLALNWTGVLPRSSVVSWEFWTNSNDECGTICDMQRTFVRDFRDLAKTLMSSGLVTFTPHYLLWRCNDDEVESDECRSQCMLGGTYCMLDPDGDVSKGYSGLDVLQVNVRQLCFFQVANASGRPELWWDYADAYAANCTMKDKKYGEDCAVQVFNALGGPQLLSGAGLQHWNTCSTAVTPAKDGKGPGTLDILEKELLAQYGDLSTASVSILPTVRINGQQYRGNLDVAGVLRGLCSAFPEGREPAVCLEKWVSEDECETGGQGYNACRVGDAAAKGRNRCTNTFTSYRCECGQGWVRSADLAGSEVCEDLNECLATNIPLTNPACSCERCACINTIGGYSCVGPLPNKCTAEYNFGEGKCWQASSQLKKFFGGKAINACVDAMRDYQRLAARGVLPAGADTYRCECPACFDGDGKAGPDGCAMRCLPHLCVEAQNVCVPDQSGGASSGGSGSGSGSKSGVGGVGVFFIVLLTISCTAGLLYAAYHFVLRKRMDSEIRSIMSQYMPLENMPANERTPLMGGEEPPPPSDPPPRSRYVHMMATEPPIPLTTTTTPASATTTATTTAGSAVRQGDHPLDFTQPHH